MLTSIKKYLPTKRKLMQLYFGLLANANMKGFISGNIYQGLSKGICTPGLNCYSCPGAVGACPLGSLQGSFSAGRNTFFYVCGILLLYCIFFGRLICGWVCPFGLIQELLYKIPTPKLKKSPVTRLLSLLKYVILVFFVLLVPIMYACRDLPLPAFCKYICPAGTLEGGISLLANRVNESYFSMLGGLFTWKFLLLVSILMGCVFAFRCFCRFLCPLGGLYGLFNRISFFGITVKASKCTRCGLCVSHCKMDIRHVGDPECISCGECIDVCPTKAISWRNGVVDLLPNEGKVSKAKVSRFKPVIRIVSGILMAVLLIFALAYYWSNSDKVPTATVVSDAARGNQVGDLCYGYDLQIMDASGDTGETINPIATGKITVINFWGTWCTPCIAELPYFDRIAADYAEDVTVIAVHSRLSHDSAPAYIAEHYPKSAIVFTKDDAADATGLNGAYYSALGGRNTYPYTVVLDENSRILSIFVSSTSYDELREVVESRLREQ